MKFSKGTGSSEIFKIIADKEIPDSQFHQEQKQNKSASIRTKEELYYYYIFREKYPHKSTLSLIGRSHSI